MADVINAIKKILLIETITTRFKRSISFISPRELRVFIEGMGRKRGIMRCKMAWKKKTIFSEGKKIKVEILCCEKCSNLEKCNKIEAITELARQEANKYFSL